MTAALDVAAAQVAARPGEVDANLDRLARLVRGQAAGADLVVCPEMVAAGYDLEQLDAHGLELGEEITGRTVTVATELAAETAATIVVGMLEREADALYDSAVVVSGSGLVASYRKTHLYPPERRRFRPGDELVAVPTEAGRLGLMICFEHAFPEIATALALAGAQILAIPSAVPAGFEHLMSVRTRARAQDNQLFAIAANLTGGPFFGGSMIVDPRGEVIAAAGGEEGLVRARIDLEAIEREREREPALALRRPELYRVRLEPPAAES